MISNLLSPRYTNPKDFFAESDEKIVLAVDLDEVCFDYLGAFRDYLVERGFKIPEGHTSHWSLVDSGWLKTEEEFREIHSQAVVDGIYDRLELLPGAHENLWDLVQSRYEINIITSRFVVNQQHQTVVQQTARALDLHDLPYSNLMFQKNKTRFIADAYLDDGPNNIEPLRNEGRFIVKINRPYNSTLGKPEAANWWHARNVLKQRFGR